VRERALGGDRKSRIDVHRAAILDTMGPDANHTIEEVAHVLEEQGLAFSFGALRRFFKRHATTRKKTEHASEKDRPDVLTKREAGFEGQIDRDPESLVFIDDT